MSKPAHPATTADLQATLEAYGADRARWPTADADRFALLISEDKGAQSMLAEAQALDRLLDAAPTVSIARERALAARIVATVRAGEATSRAKENVVAFVPAKQRSVSATAVLLRPAAALLAASLVLGIVVGSSGVTGPAATYVAEALGLVDEEPEYALATDMLATGEETL